MLKLPRGFLVSGVRCGIKKQGEDLALIYSRVPAVAAGVFTANLVKAAPVIISQQNITRPGARAIIINSGNANAATGAVGERNARKIVESVARHLAISPSEVLIASTGVIGQQLPVEKVLGKVARAKKYLGNSGRHIRKAIHSIMTTDTFAKYVYRKFFIAQKEINIFGFAKGAGMIAPKLQPSATMIACILTDLNITKGCLQKSLNSAVKDSFNRISIDADTSTNDTVFLLANGLAGNQVIRTADNNFRRWQKELSGLCQELAKKIVQDGEGTKHLLEIVVEGAARQKDADKISRTIGDSLLVKTAVFGNDPNWGRILAAIGRSAVKINPERIDIAFQVGQQKIFVYKQGQVTGYSPDKISRLMARASFRHKSAPKIKPLTIRVNLHQGKKASSYYTGDLSYDYIRINACYHT